MENYEQKYKDLIAEIRERKNLISAEKDKANSMNDKLSLGGRVAILQELLAFANDTESEDEKIRKSLIKGFQHYDKECKWGEFTTTEILAWLEKQGKKKPSWSKEDENIFKDIILDLTRLKNKDTGKEGKAAYQREIDWLKSLKDRVQPQTHWKPSEEQMQALFEAKLASINNREYFLGLLYEDLKKL